MDWLIVSICEVTLTFLGGHFFQNTVNKETQTVKLIVDIQCRDEFLGNSHHRRGNSEAEDDDTEERVNRQKESTERLRAERQQERHQPEQPLFLTTFTHTAKSQIKCAPVYNTHPQFSMLL